MKVFHQTFHSEAILCEGFKDAETTYETGQIFKGVWVQPMLPSTIMEVLMATQFSALKFLTGYSRNTNGLKKILSADYIGNHSFRQQN